MKHLNNKGYMLVEIILAFVLAMTVMYFITDLTIKLKNKNDDLLVRTLVSTDQAIIYNTIMKDLMIDSARSFSCNNITIEGNTFKYNNETTGVSFTNIISDYAEIGEISCLGDSEFDSEGNPIYDVTIKIPITVKQIPEENFDVDIIFLKKEKPYYAVFFYDDKSLRFYDASDGKISVGDTLKVSVLDENGKFTGETQELKATYVYEASEKKEYPMNQVPWFARSEITEKIIFEDEISPISTKYWFRYFRKVSLINLERLNEYGITNMEGMFFETATNLSGSDSSFKIVGLSEWQELNVTNMQSMFYKTAENVSTFDIGELNKWTFINQISDSMSLRGLFWNAGKSADTFNIGKLDNWDVSSITDMGRMFRNAGRDASTWKVGDLSGWDTKNVTNMQYMFYFYSEEYDDNGNIINIKGNQASDFNIGNLSEWNTSNVTDMQNMFYGAGYNDEDFSMGDLSTKTVTKNGDTYTAWNTSNVTNMQSMFAFSGFSASSFQIGNIGTWDVTNVTNMEQMFWNTGRNAKGFYIGDLSEWNTSKVTNMARMFRNAGVNAEKFDIGKLGNWDTSKVKDMSYMFYSYTSKDGDNVIIDDTKLENITNYIGSLSTEFNIGNLSGWNTSNVTNMSYMFRGAGYSDEDFSMGDLSGWNTSNVTNMSYMFWDAGYNAKKFEIDIGSWNTSKVKDISYMFHNCGRLSTESWSVGDLSTKTVTKNGDTYTAWNTSKVTNMTNMFRSAGSSVTSDFNIGNIGSWNVSSVTDMSGMFWNTGSSVKNSWKIGDLSGWNTSSVTDMSYMFRHAAANAATFDIGELDKWNTSNVTNMNSMFNSTARDATAFKIGNLSKKQVEEEIGNIYDAWNTSKVTNMTEMFASAAALADYSLDLSNWNVSSVTEYTNFDLYVTGKITPPVWVN